MQGLVSVVVPAFNRGFIIRAALESVLEQTYQNWEALVVNDGSTDDTSEVVREYATKDSRITLIQHDKKRGAQAARNTGIRNARGAWIAFLDSDDRWLPHSLEARLKPIQKGLHHVVHSDCYLLSSGSNNLERFGVPPMQGQVYTELLRRSGPMFQALLVSKRALAAINYLDENIAAYQEWDTAIRLAKHFSFEFVGEPTFIYDCRHANTISKDPLREAVGYEQIVNKHRWSILRYLGPKVLANHYEQAAFFYLQAKHREDAKRCSIRAAMWWPFRSGLVSGGKKHFLKLMTKRWTHAHRNSS
jgi:glycosyltransferase involved in cell wall biosynthesis